MPVMTVWKVLRKRLHMRPYHLQLLQSYLPWPPRSPDMTPLDFLFEVPVNMPELRDRIREAVAAVTPNMLIKLWDELANRLDVTNGAYIEHL
ncbi:hypothetical protein C0J52_14392 [Blattella germanica]|nr:hypothetical protein C0J52_14392 [Blattella germanica]